MWASDPVLSEEETIALSGPGDIDTGRFRAFLARQELELLNPGQPELREDLFTRGALEGQGLDPRATLYGILAFGREPQKFRETAEFFIHCTAYAGTHQLSGLVHTAEAKGTVDEQVKSALAWLKTLGHYPAFEGLTRERGHLLPERVTREALVNAVAHRDYALAGSQVLLEVFCDRVVVTSPGALPKRMRPESSLAGGHPRSRNELLANLLAPRPMEGRGRSIPIIRRVMREFNGTEPELRSDPESRIVRLTLRLVSE